jgi:hypothetical protein
MGRGVAIRRKKHAGRRFPEGFVSITRGTNREFVVGERGTD